VKGQNDISEIADNEYST